MTGPTAATGPYPFKHRTVAQVDQLMLQAARAQAREARQHFDGFGAFDRMVRVGTTNLALAIARTGKVWA